VDSLLLMFLSDVMFISPICMYCSGSISSSGIDSVLLCSFSCTPVLCSNILLLFVVLPCYFTPVVVSSGSFILSCSYTPVIA
jgi:hypothetical protein